MARWTFVPQASCYCAISSWTEEGIHVNPLALSTLTGQKAWGCIVDYPPFSIRAKGSWFGAARNMI